MDHKLQIETSNVLKAGKGLVGFMKGLRAYFMKNYPVDYVVGDIRKRHHGSA